MLTFCVEYTVTTTYWLVFILKSWLHVSTFQSFSDHSRIKDIKSRIFYVIDLSYQRTYLLDWSPLPKKSYLSYWSPLPIIVLSTTGKILPFILISITKKSCLLYWSPVPKKSYLLYWSPLPKKILPFIFLIRQWPEDDWKVETYSHDLKINTNQ
jgi:hypothetical protein